MIKGYINSVETCGTVDGPGIRYVLFLQGCVLQCKYCHNRDSWNSKNFNKAETPDETLSNILKYKNYIKNGGITLSGGEPLLQADYCLELLKLLKKEGIHTALDTSGYIFDDKIKEILKYTDLVLLDIKSINPKIYKELTCVDLKNTLLFLEYLKEICKKVWIRHVVVPTITYNEKDLEDLAKYLTNYKSIVEKVELLPYHTMGIIKWERLNKEYPLKDVKPLSKEDLDKAKNIFKKYGF